MVFVISCRLVIILGFRMYMIVICCLMCLMNTCCVWNSCSRASFAYCMMVSWLVLPTIDVGYYKETLPSVKSRATNNEDSRQRLTMIVTW